MGWPVICIVSGFVDFCQLPVDPVGKALGDDGTGLHMHLSGAYQEGHGIPILPQASDIAEAIDGFAAQEGGVFKGIVGQHPDGLVFPAQHSADAQVRQIETTARVWMEK